MRTSSMLPGGQRPTAPALIALPDRHRRLSDGVLVEASVRARVLGLRLLRLDATVVVVPARTAPLSALDARSDPPAVRALANPAPRSCPIGGRLAEANRTIEEGAELLARATDGSG